MKLEALDQGTSPGACFPRAHVAAQQPDARMSDEMIRRVSDSVTVSSVLDEVNDDRTVLFRFVVSYCRNSLTLPPQKLHCDLTEIDDLLTVYVTARSTLREEQNTRFPPSKLRPYVPGLGDLEALTARHEEGIERQKIKSALLEPLAAAALVAKKALGSALNRRAQPGFLSFSCDGRYYAVQNSELWSCPRRLTEEQWLSLIRQQLIKEEAKLRVALGTASTDSNHRRPIPQQVKIEVWQRDQGRCVACGSREGLEYDHIIPLMLGGSSTCRNLQLLCESCNRVKGASID